MAVATNKQTNKQTNKCNNPGSTVKNKNRTTPTITVTFFFAHSRLHLMKRLQRPDHI